MPRSDASKSEKWIDDLIIRYGFDPEVELELTASLLEQYRIGIDTPGIIRADMDAQAEKNQRDTMRKDFLIAIRLPLNESKDSRNRLFRNLRECPWLRELIEQVLDEIAQLGPDGQLFKRIITNYYLSPEHLSNWEMASTEHLSLATLNRKKREAIKYFGISMYQYAERREKEERDNNEDDKFA